MCSPSRIVSVCVSYMLFFFFNFFNLFFLPFIFSPWFLLHLSRHLLVTFSHLVSSYMSISMSCTHRRMMCVWPVLCRCIKHIWMICVCGLCYADTWQEQEDGVSQLHQLPPAPGGRQRPRADSSGQSVHHQVSNTVYLHVCRTLPTQLHAWHSCCLHWPSFVGIDVQSCFTGSVK